VESRDPEKKYSWTCKAPPAESMRDGDASCCNIDTKSYAREESRFRGFGDGVAVEVSVNKSWGVMTLYFPGLWPFLPFFSAAASFTALAVALVDSSKAFLASLAL
jgi:hypothetical protein